MKDFEENDLLAQMEQKYNLRTDFQVKNTLKGQIEGVNVDFKAHKYPLVSPLFAEESIRMAGLPDIAAMKLNAIVGNAHA